MTLTDISASNNSLMMPFSVLSHFTVTIKKLTIKNGKLLLHNVL